MYAPSSCLCGYLWENPFKSISASFENRGKRLSLKGSGSESNIELSIPNPGQRSRFSCPGTRLGPLCVIE